MDTVWGGWSCVRGLSWDERGGGWGAAFSAECAVDVFVWNVEGDGIGYAHIGILESPNSELYSH